MLDSGSTMLDKVWTISAVLLVCLGKIKTKLSTSRPESPYLEMLFVPEMILITLILICAILTNPGPM